LKARPGQIDEIILVFDLYFKIVDDHCLNFLPWEIKLEILLKVYVL
jgi:hypothetical protein